MLGFGYHGFYSFSTHSAVFLGLIALGFGYWICLQARQDTKCPKWGKFLGVLISLVALLGLICVGYLSIKRCCMGQKGDGYQKHMERMMPSPEAPAK